jgi:hypothetical protein
MKTPEPIIEPITRVVESNRPRPLTRSEGCEFAVAGRVPISVGALNKRFWETVVDEG